MAPTNAPHDETEHSQDEMNAAVVNNLSDETVPQQKSSVYVDPFASRGGNKFQKEDTVHMSIIENGSRLKGTYTVRSVNYNETGGYWEYELSNGKWVREKALKLDRARQS